MATSQSERPAVGRARQLVLVPVLGAIVVVILAGLLLPAVQSARRSGRGDQAFGTDLATTRSVAGAESSGSPAELDLYDARSGTSFAPMGGMVAAAPYRMGQAAPPSAPAPAPNPAPATTSRKIIRDATVALVTEDLNKFEAALLALVEARGAYVADSDRSGRVGETRRGSWKVRVPADSYDAFLRGATALGELVSTRANAQDVSAEYYDLDARLGAKKVEEARLLKHLADSTGRLDEILAVERELARVRGEIEQMQGRLNVLTNLTALATVAITATEIKGYVPPQAPALGQKVARTFAASFESLREFGESALLAAVALAPWLPILIPAALLLLILCRRVLARLARVSLPRAEAAARPQGDPSPP